MEEALKLFQSYQQVKQEPCLQEEALIMVDSLAIFLKGGFYKYMPLFSQQLKIGLENASDIKSCTVSLGMVGDLARGLDKTFIEFSDVILNIVFTHLQNPAVDRKIKAAIMPLFGDVAI